ncbi:helix-turn-helix transcriptional regulator [Amycolatopsis solani]|uniref:helix-turn-helix transcriptional regulator n=1 Tax=Amycolatopsis solani TaxID=3028615 RepID=UPI0025AF85F1|nr:helix-turn-helix transcriptional regulator [Amycolatopsis sp. MEP2-6]
MTDDITKLGSMLRTWRGRVSPDSVGLPGGHRRRVAGLRREDLAQLAGISVDYVVRLEQGRHVSPSAQVTAALARALQLTEAERDHLYRLAGLAPPSSAEVSDHIPPGLHRIVNRLGDAAAAAVFAADWQLIWWNRSWAALLGDPSTTPAPLRNFARDTFPVDGATPCLSRWPVLSLSQPEVEASIVSDLRRATGRFPGSGRLEGLIRDLMGNPRFAELWASGAVSAHREEHKIVHHPTTGPIAVDCDVLTDGDAEHKIVVLTAAPGTADETNFRLAVVSGTSSTAGVKQPLS